jgi:hypothetical protein
VLAVATSRNVTLLHRRKSHFVGLRFSLHRIAQLMRSNRINIIPLKYLRCKFNTSGGMAEALPERFSEADALALLTIFRRVSPYDSEARRVVFISWKEGTYAEKSLL